MKTNRKIIKKGRERMFRHIVLYKLKNNSDENKKKLAEKFLSMEGKIPQIRELGVGIDCLGLERSFDVSLSILFDTIKDFLDYKESPYHKQEVVPYVHSVTEKSVSVDSEI